MGCSITDPLSCLSSAAKAAASDAFGSIAHDFGQLADSAINWLWAQMSTATAVHLGGSGFALDVGIVVAITATVAVGLFAIQLITSAVRRDPGGLARACKGLLVAFIGGGVAIAVTNLFISAIDSLSAGVVQVATGRSIDQVGHSILAVDAITAATNNPAGIILLSLAALIAVVVVWASLVVRKVLIIVSAVFAPLAFAGSLADITVAWTRRWIEVMVALIVSKLILVIIFVVGLGVLMEGVGQAGGGPTQTITQVASGILVLVVAGFAPWLALKLVHFSGEQFHHLHTLAGAATGGAQTAVAAPQKVAALTSAATSVGGGISRSSGRGTNGAGGAGGAQQAAPRLDQTASLATGGTVPSQWAGVSGQPGPGRPLSGDSNPPRSSGQIVPEVSPATTATTAGAGADGERVALPATPTSPPPPASSSSPRPARARRTPPAPPPPTRS